MTEMNLGARAGEANEHESLGRLIQLSREFHCVFRYGGFQSLNPRELQVLLAVRHTPDMTVCAIAKTLGLARPSVSNAITRLQERRLLVETVDDHDHRIHRQRLSGRGARLIDVFLAWSTDALAQAPGV
jgi:DNA-binding MarR family transcriptional regulator